MAGQDLTSAFLLACDEQNLTLERVFSQHTHLANILGHRIMTKIYCFYMVNLKICTLNLFFTGVMPSLLCHLESYVKEINSLGIVLVFLFSQFSFQLFNHSYSQLNSRSGVFNRELYNVQCTFVQSVYQVILRSPGIAKYQAEILGNISWHQPDHNFQ